MSATPAQTDLARIARAAKVIAVVGFFLPWLVASCSGQPLLTATGFDLASGNLTVANPANGTTTHHNSGPDLLVLLAFLAVAGGLGLSFLYRGREAMRVMLASSAAAFLLSAGGEYGAVHPRPSAFNDGADEQSGAQAFSSGMIRIDVRYGFYVTLFALAAAGGACAFSLYGPSDQFMRRRLTGAPATDEDTQFWDRLTDKNDVDLLREYLIRFPQGRFSGLARDKLARLQQKGPALGCVACESSKMRNLNFCESCGAPLTEPLNS